MTDLVPEWGGPTSPEIEKMVEDAVEARQEFVKSNEYVMRTTKSYLKNMTCMVPNEHHRTYSDEPKLLCVTLPASLVFKLVENNERKDKAIANLRDDVEYHKGRTKSAWGLIKKLNRRAYDLREKLTEMENMNVSG